MEIKGKVHCFFEQSGTFKNEFIKLGYQAEDYDIQNNFGQTDHKIDYFSYQTLRRIVSQRYNHRKPEFHEFIEWVKTLPYADELILLGLEEKLDVHNKMYNEYLSEE